MIGSSLGQDLRHGARMLMKQPGFAFIAIVTLALGIGANAAMYSLIHRALIRPLPFPDPDQLVMIWNRYDRYAMPKSSLSGPDVPEMRAAESFAGVAAFEMADMTLTGLETPSLIPVTRANASLGSVLGVAPARGRWFHEREDEPGRDDVVVLSDGSWRRRFHADPAIVGKTIRLDGRSRHVVGVMPPGFDFPSRQLGNFPRSEAWVPLALTAAQRDPARRGVDYLMAIARLRDGVAPARAQAELNTIAQRFLQSPGGAEFREYGWAYAISVLRDDAVQPVRTPLLLLFGAVGFVLLIACSNVSHLLLARVGARRREIALRTALGASRGRIAQQFLAESLLLALAGGTLGLLLGYWSARLFEALPLRGLPSMDGGGLEPAVIAFTFGVSVVTGVLFGTLPAMQALRTEPHDALKETTGTIGSRSRSRLRDTLVTAEVALTVVLLVGAGLAIRSLQELLAVPPGFDPDGAVTARVTLPPDAYADSARQVAFFDQVLRRVAGRPGIEAAGAVVTLPLGGGGWRRGFDVPGQAPGADRPMANYRPVAGDYFRAMGMRLVRGSDFSPAARAGRSREVIVDQALVRRHLPEGEPVGRTLDLDGETWRIAGVVADVKEEGLDVSARPVMYVPFAHSPIATMAIVVRGEGRPAGALHELRRAIRDVDAGVPVYDAFPLADVVARSAAAPRARATLLGLFALLATFLAAIGIYGLVSHAVALRTREIGVRMALGATRDHVLGVVVRQGLRPILIGLIAGLAGALALSRVMASQLYGVRTTDPVTYTVIALLIVLVALAAMIVPARRAIALDPITALRQE